MTSRYQSGWRRSTPRSTRTNCSRLSSKSAKSRLATKSGQTRSSRGRAGDGPCHCQHRWRSDQGSQRKGKISLCSSGGDTTRKLNIYGDTTRKLNIYGSFNKSSMGREAVSQRRFNAKQKQPTKSGTSTGRRSGPWKRWRLCTRGQSRSTRTSPK